VRRFCAWDLGHPYEPAVMGLLPQGLVPKHPEEEEKQNDEEM
jgi:hypothetical protein